MYAMENINVSISQCNETNLWWSSVSCNIYHFNKWDSATELIQGLERSDFKSLYISKKCNFIKRLAVSNDFVISMIVTLYFTSNEYYSFVNNTGLHIYMSSHDIMLHLFDTFSTKVSH